MNYCEPTGERLPHGVRRRHDGKGVVFGRLHRERLGAAALMTDIDGMVISENRLFAEYAIEGANVAFCAFFDAKTSERAAGIVPLRRRVLCALARSVGRAQPVAPLAFEVLGIAEPFCLWELSIATAERTGRRWYLTGASWRDVWRESGITATRERLGAWLRAKGGRRRAICHL